MVLILWTFTMGKGKTFFKQMYSSLTNQREDNDMEQAIHSKQHTIDELC